MNRKFRTLDDLEEDYFSEHPEQIEPYLSEIFEDFAEDGNTAALLSSLRIIARVKGVSDVARKSGMTRKGLQKALSAEGNPRLENMNSIMKALGYHLSPQRSEVHA